MNRAKYTGVSSQYYEQKDGETAYPFFNWRPVTVCLSSHGCLIRSAGNQVEYKRLLARTLRLQMDLPREGTQPAEEALEISKQLSKTEEQALRCVQINSSTSQKKPHPMCHRSRLSPRLRKTINIHSHSHPPSTDMMHCFGSFLSGRPVSW